MKMKTNSMTRTLMFAGTAVLATVLALAANHLTKPVRIDGDSDFGKDFFPDFTDARKATSMRVVTFEEETAAARMFAVEYKDGWKIPSHHNYPADGKDQLAKAAASVIGLKRGSLVTRRKADHERYGVIDPLDENNPATKGRGTRITISENDVALADLIIGKKADTDGDKRYVRKMGEEKVYIVSAKFDVSTKFSDWAETDLLKVSGFDIIRLRGSRPKFNESDEYEGDEVVELSREKSGDPWKLAGLNEATEELKTDDISTMVNTLDDLRLVGVRPRPTFQGKPLLNADLKVELPKELMSDPQVRTEIVRVLRSDLGEKGFKVGQDESGQTQLISREGELIAGTKDGVVYRLTFGSVFTGTEEEIAIGSQSDSKDESEAKKKDSKDDGKKSRYLIVRVNFDESLLGPPPTEPVAPTPPPGVEPPTDDKKDESKTDADAKKDADAKNDADAKKDTAKQDDAPAKPEQNPQQETEKKSEDDKNPATDSDSKTADSAETKDPAESQDDEEEDRSAKTEEKSSDKKPDTDKPDAEKPKAPQDEQPKADQKPADSKSDATKSDATKSDETKSEESKKDLKAEYLEALKRYDAEKGRYASDLAARNAKIESGKKTVDELNQRFADWYYVISNDSFEKLRLSRSALIKLKEAPAAKPEDSKTEDQKPADERKETSDGGGDPQKSASNDDKKKPDTKDDTPAVKDDKPAVKDEKKEDDASTESK